MELRSGRYIASGEARRRVELSRALSIVPDHINNLPDDLLLLILARLDCVATAARTGVLARRWRGLWTRLRALVFPDVPFNAVTTALSALRAAGEEVSLLDIRVARATRRVTPLLCAAAWLRPEELVLDVVRNLYMPVDLTCFDRATSISLCIGKGKYPAELCLPPAGGGGECLFPALTTLVLSGYYSGDGLAALLPHCPRLRVLRYAVRRDWPSRHDYAMTVHSATLRELVVEESAELSRVDVATPMLDQLTLSCVLADDDLSTVSIVAPVAEKVSWHCYPSGGLSTGFACWYLDMVSMTSPAPAVETRLRPWLLRIDARMRIGSGTLWMDVVDLLEKKVEKHLQLKVAADLSAMDLELHLNSAGHVYGALVLHLLGIPRVRIAVHKLKLSLLPEWYTGGGGCHPFCQCGSTEWRSQTVSLTELEEVEIDVFQGEDHQFEFLEVISRCAPMLRRVTVKTLEDTASIHTRIRGVFKAHPSVECLVLSSE